MILSTDNIYKSPMEKFQYGKNVILVLEHITPKLSINK